MNGDVIQFAPGQTVYSAVDGETRGLVTGVIFRPGHHLYFVIWAGALGTENQHYEMELLAEPKFGGAEGKEETSI